MERVEVRGPGVVDVHGRGCRRVHVPLMGDWLLAAYLGAGWINVEVRNDHIGIVHQHAIYTACAR